MEITVAHRRADTQFVMSYRQPVKPGDRINIDEMRRARQAESHDRHQALPSQHSAVVRRQLLEQCHRVAQSRRTMFR